MTLQPGASSSAASSSGVAVQPSSVGPPAGPPPSGRLPRWAKILLFVLLPALVVLAFTIVILLFFVLRGTGYSDVLESRAGSRIEVDIPNATLDLKPGETGAVRIEVSGSYLGRPPEVQVDSLGNNTTEITGGCRGGWLNFCRLRLTLYVPESVDLDVVAQNGSISADGLSGDLSVATQNGAVSVEGAAGTLELSTTNGAVEMEDATSAVVAARSTNGRVTLEFAQAPDTVAAETVNGEVVITVPVGSTAYDIRAGAVNGSVDTSTVPNDPSARRIISAQTVNGAVNIQGARE